MDTDAEIKAKIAALEARVQHQKQTAPFAPYPQYHGHQHHPTRPYYRGGYTANNFAPRGGRGGFRGAHRNNTLVVNKPSADIGRGEEATAEESSKVHVQKRGFRQLINKSSEQGEVKSPRNEIISNPGTHSGVETQSATEPKEEATREPKPNITVRANQELEINGVVYRMARDGSKMERAGAGQSRKSHKSIVDKLMAIFNAETNQQTPKKLVLHGVEYQRTKKGNLRRKQEAKPLARYQSTLQSRNYSHSQRYDHRSLPKRQCETFSRKGIYRHGSRHSGYAGGPDTPTHGIAGNCPRGSQCAFAHNLDKIAVCRTHLFTGSCEMGDNCDLSHDTSYARAPACTFFVSGNCTNPACRYPHVKVSSSAPLCMSFGRLGYCPKGDDCAKRHVFDECPEYSNTGSCKLLKAGKRKCELQHIDRASTMRKREQKAASREDISDTEEEEEEDTDSDGVEEDDVVMTGTDNYAHELTQQQDFVSFD